MEISENVQTLHRQSVVSCLCPVWLAPGSSVEEMRKVVRSFVVVDWAITNTAGGLRILLWKTLLARDIS